MLLYIYLGALNVIAAILLWFFLKQRSDLITLRLHKHQFDMLQTVLIQCVTRGGWMTVVHEGKPYPVGLLLDKLDPETEAVQ